jgi:hypothetical protein
VNMHVDAHRELIAFDLAKVHFVDRDGL